MLALFLLAAAFTGEMWERGRPVYETTLEHPFLKGLSDGSLPRDKFQFYLEQDAQYLRVFGQALSVLASKAPHEDWARTLNRHAVDAVEVERALHETILVKFGVQPNRASRARMAPVNVAYTNHLLVAVERGTFAEGLAAMLPCYWIYWEAGKVLVKRGSKNREYQQWIDQYASEDYGKSVREVLAMMDAVAPELTAAQRERCLALFERGARYEWMFWDMAWRKESWPPQ
jgi:thiaminase (transcriptional activator TenA)